MLFQAFPRIVMTVLRIKDRPFTSIVKLVIIIQLFLSFNCWLIMPSAIIHCDGESRIARIELYTPYDIVLSDPYLIRLATGTLQPVHNIDQRL